MNNLKSGLNLAQQTVVDTIDGPLLVIAGPGSGKTTILTQRVVNILKQTDTLASSILCITFTESAAVNMREKLTKIMGKDAYKINIHTFHSLGTEIINRNPEYFFWGANYQPIDQIGQIQILQEIFQNLSRQNILSKKHPEQGFVYLQDSLRRISNLKKGGLTPANFSLILQHNLQFLEQFNPILQDFFIDRISKKHLTNFDSFTHQVASITEEKFVFPNYFSLKQTILQQLEKVRSLIQENPSTTHITSWKNNIAELDKNKQLVAKDFLKMEKYQSLAEIYALYQDSLRKSGQFDFDDMLLEVVEAMKQNPDLRYNYQEKFLYVLVDEFQDTSGVQMNLLDLIVDPDSNEGLPNIMAVGDDDQAIFKFQGATLQNILNFTSKYQNTKIVVMNENYRSTQDILDMAMQVIEQNSQRLTDYHGLDKHLVSRVDGNYKG